MLAEEFRCDLQPMVRINITLCPILQTDQKIKNIMSDKAEQLCGSDPDYSNRDLYEAIDNGNFVSIRDAPISDIGISALKSQCWYWYFCCRYYRYLSISSWRRKICFFGWNKHFSHLQ